MTPVIDLALAREIRRALGEGRLPRDGWPVIHDDSAWHGRGLPVPKCSMVECCEPAVAHVQSCSLLGISSASASPCADHLEHFGRATAELVRETPR